MRKFMLVFMDDILVFSKTLEDHIEHLRVVFQILSDNQLFIKFSKCTFVQQQLSYLGHIISHEGVATDPAKTEAMQHWLVPTNFTELRGFLGLTRYYRKFVRDYGSLARPLTNLLHHKVFSWTEAAHIAFDKLKHAMSTTLVLVFPDFQRNLLWRLVLVTPVLGQYFLKRVILLLTLARV
jgi:hypothetical protein